MLTKTQRISPEDTVVAPRAASLGRLSKLIRSAGRRIAVMLGLAVAVFAVSPANSAPVLSPCAWPVEGSSEGFGNIALPDNLARYWVMPFDKQWIRMTIKGTYPNARYFSFVVYEGEVPTGVAGHLFDAQITPDPGSTNPFVPPRNRGGSYTVRISRTPLHQANVIQTSLNFAWIVLRLYLPDAGENSMGDVPLPGIAVTDWSGVRHPVERCPRVNIVSDVNTFLSLVLPPQFDTQGTGVPPSTDRLWFAAPKNPPSRLFPNPDNKYMAMWPGPFQPGRIVVIRGRGAAFPDTFNGSPIWRPADGFENVQLRYWSLCHNDFANPFPVVMCTSDLNTTLDRDGFYTIVISDDQLRPDWVPAKATWLPWGDELLAKFVYFRTMLPAARFHQAIQDAIAHGCTFTSDFPTPPTTGEIEAAGRCAQRVMGEYYPVAVWCNQSTFIDKGWQACLLGSR